MKLFESTRDLDNLPNSKQLKCYIHCTYVEFQLIKPNGTKFDFSRFLEVMAKMDPEDANKYYIMGKGCAKKLKPIKDSIEYVYQYHVCQKTNSLEVIIII